MIEVFTFRSSVMETLHFLSHGLNTKLTRLDMVEQFLNNIQNVVEEQLYSILKELHKIQHYEERGRPSFFAELILITYQSDGEVPVILEHWRMCSSLTLPSLPGSLWPGVVAPDRALSISQIELNCALMLK